MPVARGRVRPFETAASRAARLERNLRSELFRTQDSGERAGEQEAEQFRSAPPLSSERLHGLALGAQVRNSSQGDEGRVLPDWAAADFDRVPGAGFRLRPGCGSSLLVRSSVEWRSGEERLEMEPLDVVFAALESLVSRFAGSGPDFDAFSDCRLFSAIDPSNEAGPYEASELAPAPPVLLKRRPERFLTESAEASRAEDQGNPRGTYPVRGFYCCLLEISTCAGRAWRAEVDICTVVRDLTWAV